MILMTVLYQTDSYLFLFISAHAQNKQFLLHFSIKFGTELQNDTYDSSISN